MAAYGIIIFSHPMNLRWAIRGIVSALAVASSCVLRTGVVIAEPLCRMNGREVPCEELSAHLGNLAWVGVGLAVFILVFGFFAFVFWIAMIVHVVRHDVKDKTMWIVLLVFTGLIGALIYYFVGKRDYDRTFVGRTDA